jgi:DNA primase
LLFVIEIKTKFKILVIHQTLDDEKNLFHCFSCGAGGDIFKFVGELESIGFAQSVESLAEIYNVKLETTRGTGASGQMKRDSLQLQQHAMEEAAQWFASKLFNPSAGNVRSYVRQRGFSPYIVQEWGIGWSPPGITQHMLSLNYSLDLLKEIGLVGAHTKTDGGYFERFQHRLMVPIRNEKGNVVGFGGRQLIDDPQYPKYINSKESSLFEKRNILFGAHSAKQSTRRLKSCIIVEGYFDVISLHSAGIRNVVASMGTALSLDQLSAANRLCQGGRLVLAMDGDDAGVAATMRMCETLLCSLEQFDVQIVRMPNDCKDANDVVLKYGSHKFSELVQDALPWTEWYVHALIAQLPGCDANTFAKRVDKLSDIISLLPSPHMRTFTAFKFSQILSKELGISFVSHERQLELDLLAAATKKRKVGTKFT